MSVTNLLLGYLRFKLKIHDSFIPLHSVNHTAPPTDINKLGANMTLNYFHFRNHVKACMHMY